MIASPRPILPTDRHGHPIPLLRPTDQSSAVAIDSSTGDVLDIAVSTRAVSLICLGDGGNYGLGDGSLTVTGAVHHICDGERLVFAADEGDVKLAVKAEIGVATFHLTELA